MVCAQKYFTYMSTQLKMFGDHCKLWLLRSWFICEVLFDPKCKISGILKNLLHYFYWKLALFLPLWIINHELTREGLLSKQGHICTISLEQSLLFFESIKMFKTKLDFHEVIDAFAHGIQEI